MDAFLTQKEYFQSGATLPLEFRLAQLRSLYRGIKRFEPQILEALRSDLGKSAEESYMSEIGMCLTEIRHTARHLREWSRPQRVPTPLMHFPGSSRIIREPRGACLIIAPWNYPFLLAVGPMISAIAAGNCVTLKPSEYAPATAAVLEKMLDVCFEERFCRTVTGGAEVSAAETARPYDMIFFTGSTAVGRKVMAAAAQNLTPVVLELGGKSPCIVDETADLPVAAARIIWGKCLNSGQTCVAPDYVLVARSRKDALIREMQKAICRFYGEDPCENSAYPRIVNEQHFDRLAAMLPEDPAVGGRVDRESLRIEPTLIETTLNDQSPLMTEEIFGPLLPIVPYDNIHEALGYILSRPRPLALYLFSRNRKLQRRVVETIPFGGGCINDTISHITTPYLPFGGTGDSGMGAYHGRCGYETFTHAKSILSKPFRPDLPVRYPPLTGKLDLLHKILR
ncbi:aldehyde dehydrogenase [Hydrogenoanaerobacterium saccharovorans]|uniref:Aldehyde dehydrogenase n=1 Tax=Hydrogenoanaerobacterium saccharovorans TaxID=474960 RepID=A0ABS2GMM0_9FIRM|nr:aldehyde dehydrogenase [Hydrogenoanaerobacterium saccharovorans]MBM6923058.1 aldehyde dehydrogenase [Hydrogenoanaerobacterium saccharovorans]